MVTEEQWVHLSGANRAHRIVHNGGTMFYVVACGRAIDRHPYGRNVEVTNYHQMNSLPCLTCKKR